MIDAIDPKGTHDRRVYEAIGQVHGEMEHYEKYLTRGKMAYDVASISISTVKWTWKTTASKSVPRRKPMIQCLI